jgi:hypothetical protein
MDRYIPFILIPLIAWGVRHHLVRKNDWWPLKKVTLGIGISAWFLTEMARSFYRPYIYSNQINDWLVADTIGNSLGTVTAIYMILTMSGRGTPWDWRLVGMVIAGLLAYEMINLLGGHPFDLNDVIATFIFGGLSTAIYAWVLSRYTKESITGLAE